MQRVIGKLALVSLFLALTGCGGSSFPLALAISTSPGTVSGGGTYTFSATTTNSTTQSGVIWSLALNTPSSTTDTTTPCSSPCGTWVNAGTTVTSQTTSGSTTYYNTVTSITYTAPLTPPTPNSIVLTAAAPSNAAITADVIFEVGTPSRTLLRRLRRAPRRSRSTPRCNLIPRMRASIGLWPPAVRLAARHAELSRQRPRPASARSILRRRFCQRRQIIRRRLQPHQ